MQTRESTVRAQCRRENPQYGRSADERIPQYGRSADWSIPQYGHRADWSISQYGHRADGLGCECISEKTNSTQSHAWYPH